MKWNALGRFSNFGLLVLRIVIGIAFIMYGWSKFQGGENMLAQVGSSISNLGVHDGNLHYYFGVAAAGGEMLGGMLFILGWFFRPACLMLTFIMTVAVVMHVKKGDSFTQGYSHALELLSIFLGMLFVGPGGISLDGNGKAAAAPKAKKEPAEK